MERRALRGIPVILCTLVISWPVAGWAQPEGETTPPPTEPPAVTDEDGSTMGEEASTPDGAARVTERLATEFQVEASQIQALRDQQMGYGEIHHALSLAKTMPGGITDENVNQILAMRQEQKMGWGRIAQELGTKLGPATKQGGTASTTEPPPTGTGATTDTTVAPSAASTQTQSVIRQGYSPGASGKAKGPGWSGGLADTGFERSGGSKAKGPQGTHSSGGAVGGVGASHGAGRGGGKAKGHSR